MALNSVWYYHAGNGTTTGYYAVAAWAAGATIAAGALRRPSAPTAGNERVVVAIVAGTTHATTEPTWTTTKGAKNTDNTVTWQECTGQPGVNGDVVNTPASSAVRSTSIPLGQIIKNNAATHLFIASTAGTSGAGEPTFNTTAGATTADSGCTWTCIGAVGAFSLWSAPHGRLVAALSTSWMISGDTLYVSSTSNESYGSAFSVNVGNNSSNPTKIICVANGGSAPPGPGDVTTGAQFSTTGVNAITLNYCLDVWGMTWNCGSGNNNTTLTVASNDGASVRLRNGQLNLTSTNGSAHVDLGAPVGSALVLDNTPISFGAAQTITLRSCHLSWRDTPAAISLNAGATYPSTLFTSTLERGGDALLENLDLGNFPNVFTGGNCGAHTYTLTRCKVNAAMTPFATGSQNSASARADLYACDSGANALRHERWWFEGTQTLDLVAVRTGGASDGSTAYAWRVVTNGANTAIWAHPFETMPIAEWNPTAGATVTVTIEGAFSGAALPNNDEVWLEVSYPGTAGSTVGSRATSTKANPLSTPAAVTASTKAWDGAATARQNSHAYLVGDIIKLASNPGRLFYCTSFGTSAGSEPGGYASAVDGGNVTDGGAVFQAIVRFALSVALSAPQPQYAGLLSAVVRFGRASSTFWIDPRLTLS